MNYKPITKTDEANSVDCNLSDDISLSYFNNVLNLQKDPHDLPHIPQNLNSSSHDNHRENEPTKNIIVLKEENENLKRIKENYNKLTNNEEKKKVNSDEKKEFINEKPDLLNKTCDKIKEKSISCNNLENSIINESKMPNVIDAISKNIEITKTKPMNGIIEKNKNGLNQSFDEIEKQENLDIENWEDLFDENGQIERDLMPQVCNINKSLIRNYILIFLDCKNYKCSK